MKKLFLLFNHKFTPEQEADARASLEVEEIVELPPDLARLWRQIPADMSEIGDFLEPVRQWLARESVAGDAALIQGDFGACALMVEYARERGLVPVYSTTERKAREETLPDGSVRMSHQFKHTLFRKYGE
ncbi:MULTISPECIES: CRISPR-associated protein Csx20 [Desulfatibacillum]|uniref:Uncharacterized protein n=1 Tax=Desulfatibacillum alkenivorans DSM 16219 TaxID=1121393 RepID=A0A1M6QT46_9BACT|nr:MULTISPECIES: CRISPR-associated protein Csx20 [Desulfatibacillum]SHK23489.1 hypothetical protein SAMN02745216_03138 [Desulfatibacillum alkenivorans DSM 16219]